MDNLLASAAAVSVLLNDDVSLECCNMFLPPFPSTGDEMFSDAFKVKESENGIFFEVEGKVSLKPHVQQRI